jgi:hypothetical protein
LQGYARFIALLSKRRFTRRGNSILSSNHQTRARKLGQSHFLLERKRVARRNEEDHLVGEIRLDDHAVRISRSGYHGDVD